MKAQCQCGQITVEAAGSSPAVVACHCIDCQRRSGSPFGVAAYYPTEALTIKGAAKKYTRATALGGEFHTYFCPNCGTSVYQHGDKNPQVTGVTIGAIADPDFPAPIRSVWEQSKLDWVTIPTATEHHPRGRGG